MNKLDYFKKELIRILDSKEKDSLSKALLVEQIGRKVLGNDFYLEKANRSHLVPKQIQKRNPKTGKVFTTTVYINPNKQYGLNKYHEQDSKGAKIAIAKLKATINNCKTPEELLKVVLRNKDRFMDADGKPLPIVNELRKWVDGKNRDFNIIKNEKESYTNHLRNKLKHKLENKLGKHKNIKTGIEANLSNSSIDKMSSNKAIEKSKNNGFSIREHFEVASNIVELYTKASLVHVKADDHGSKDLKSIKRFDCDYLLNSGKKCIAHITVKESVQHGHKIYSLEVLDLEKNTADTTSAVGGEIPKETPTSNIILEDNTKNVKRKTKYEININNMPQNFRENEDIQKTVKYMQENPSVNENVNFLFQNTDKIIGNIGVTSTLKKANYDRKYYFLTLKKIQKETEIDCLETNIHEWVHALDHACGKKESTYGPRVPYSILSEKVKIRTTILNSHLKTIPKDTLEFLSKYEDIKDGKTVANREIDKIFEEHKDLQSKVINKEVDIAEANKLAKKMNARIGKIQDEHTFKLDKVAIGHFEDIYDALSGGKFRQSGLITFGHGNLFKKTNERTQEILANYIALTYTQPELIEKYLRKDVPELCTQLDILIQGMADEWKEKLGMTKSYSYIVNQILQKAV